MAKPELQDEPISFQRTPTWNFSRNAPTKILSRDDPDPSPAYTEEDKQRFRDSAELRKYRKTVQGDVNKSFKLFIEGSDYNSEMTEFAINQMEERPSNDPILCEKFIPEYELGCRRITPGPDTWKPSRRQICVLRTARSRTLRPREARPKMFVRYGDQIHKTLTWTGGCRSGYKADRVNGRVTKTFAGSVILLQKLVNRRLRPEVFGIKYMSANRWRFLGNGLAGYELDEVNGQGDYIP